MWDKRGGTARRVLLHAGPVVEVQLVGWRLVSQHLHVGTGRGSSTTLWDVHGGARLAIWDGWACLGPQAAQVCVQGDVQLGVYDTLSARLSQLLRHPRQERSVCTALALSSTYAVSATAPDGELDDDEHAQPNGWYVAAWRLLDGAFLGFLGPHPWEVEAVSLVGHAAVCIAYEAKPPHVFVWDLSALPGARRAGGGSAVRPVACTRGLAPPAARLGPPSIGGELPQFCPCAVQASAASRRASRSQPARSPLACTGRRLPSHSRTGAWSCTPSAIARAPRTVQMATARACGWACGRTGEARRVKRRIVSSIAHVTDRDEVVIENAAPR